MALKRKDRPQAIAAFLALLNSTNKIVDDEGTVCELEEEKRKAGKAHRKEEKKRKDAELQKAEAARKAAEEAKRRAEEEAEKLRQQQSDRGKRKMFGGLAIAAAVIAAILMFSNGNDSTGSQVSSGITSNINVVDNSEAQRQAEAQRVAADKAYENFNVSVRSNTFNNGYQDFVALSVQGTDTKTIVKKKCIPTYGTYMYCSPDEFIEDCATGKRYHLNGSTIGVNSRKEFYDTTPFYYSEYYPKLPKSVTRINVSSGSFYYAKNVQIR